MVTALALYSGRALSEFELVGLTTNPELVRQVLALLADHDPALLRKPRKPKRPSTLQLMPEPAE
jgi:hypothetical protein